MRYWNYDNDQWTKLPSHVKHLPLFTQHYDLTSRVIRFIWSLILKNWFYTMYMRLEVKGGNFADLYKQHKKLIIMSNHASHLDATSIAASIPRKHWMDLYMAAAKDYFFSNWLFNLLCAKYPNRSSNLRIVYLNRLFSNSLGPAIPMVESQSLKFEVTA